MDLRLHGAATGITLEEQTPRQGTMWLISLVSGRAPVVGVDPVVFGGPGRVRTVDLFHAMEARSQLRHRPIS